MVDGDFVRLYAKPLGGDNRQFSTDLPSAGNAARCFEPAYRPSPNASSMTLVLIEA
jgi:hypothetical protein